MKVWFVVIINDEGNPEIVYGSGDERETRSKANDWKHNPGHRTMIQSVVVESVRIEEDEEDGDPCEHGYFRGCRACDPDR